MKHPSLRFVRGPIVALLVLALAATTPVGAEESEDFGRSVRDEIDRFDLWNACEPIYLLIEGLGDGAVKSGLTHEAITTTVRSRLRAARLYRGSRRSPHLYVNVNALSGGRAFNVFVGFNKPFFDRISGRAGSATTWDTRMVGQGDAAYILSLVSQLTDKFIDEYLRVNDSACQGPGQS